MSDNLSNIFLITDVDGTLLDDNHKISNRNKEAIKELIKAGGKFTIATGRGVSMAIPIIEELGVLEPAVIFNGAAVYDFTTKRTLWHSELPLTAYSYIKQLHETFSTIAIEVLSEDKVYVLVMNDLEKAHLKLGGVTPVLCGFDEITRNGWLKSLIIDTPENIDRIIEFVTAQNNDDVNWVRSSPVYYEMLPKNANKGLCFKKLLQLTDNTNRFVVAVGDFMNDIEMIEMADLGFAVKNSQESVKKAADLIIGSNNDDAIYQIVEYLKEKDRSI